ncbi:hypothetical protein XI07_15910 [Bradyrhizobium sp. CCBAU 11445]|uniref:hypothetical protein n=1 Tax=Bradyrhizobium sp. CCBAU 11434 TaxID=1630885 RepID=UPI002305B7AE|nr:hypothetical protein [Bradyrhizobium sp. CCBAU 11434]MDA9483467.1 hypothetical protein [Bradyrhizobium sp. CCBAU 11445]MDA9523296.1 hypothetical protein [Bradyrhizobium sp. CCBAU 11434]
MAVIQAVGHTSMEEYAAFTLGPDGHILQRVNIICADEDTAKKRTYLLAEDCAVELWQGARKITEYPARH